MSEEKKSLIETLTGNRNANLEAILKEGAPRASDGSLLGRLVAAVETIASAAAKAATSYEQSVDQQAEVHKASARLAREQARSDVANRKQMRSLSAMLRGAGTHLLELAQRRVDEIAGSKPSAASDATPVQPVLWTLQNFLAADERNLAGVEANLQRLKETGGSEAIIALEERRAEHLKASIARLKAQIDSAVVVSGSTEAKAEAPAQDAPVADSAPAAPSAAEEPAAPAEPASEG